MDRALQFKGELLLARQQMLEQLAQDGLHSMRRMRQAVESAEALFAAGVDVGSVHFLDLRWPTWEVRRQDLPRVRRALGALRYGGKAPASPTEAVVRLVCTDERFSEVEVKFRVPVKEGGPCRVVKATCEYLTLVCDNPGAA